jgi:hypothetical protein
MQTIGVFLLLIGVGFLYSGVVSINPISTMRAIVSKPSDATNIINSAVAAAKELKPSTATGAQLDAPSTVGSDIPVATGDNTPASAKTYAQGLFSSFGWSADQFQYLDKLWTRESNWNYQALNKSSGAYGIPQALPGTKMMSAGSDWKTNANTQVRWGLEYIKGRYGTPEQAWQHSQDTGWY